MNKFKSSALATAITAATLALTPAVNAAEQLSDKLSVSGFIDMSYVSVDIDGVGSESSSNLDQFELNFSYDLDDKLKAYVDLEYQNDKTDVEQAFITYAVSDQFTVKAGRFLSYSGWETEEPTGLFQYSGTGYAAYFYGGYQQGVSGLYTGDGFSAALSVVNDLAGEGTDSEDPAIEAMLAFMPSETVTVKGFYMTDKLAGTDETTTLVNIWASYSEGPITLAVEYNTSENAPAAVEIAGLNAEADGFLLMGNYAFDSAGITLRYHDYSIDPESGSGIDASGFTISPSYTVSDNLLMVFEYRMEEIEDVDINSIAIEALITF